ncbi:hypothetical protein ACVB8X_42755 [Streptomyces sp. NRAIS4]
MSQDAGPSLVDWRFLLGWHRFDVGGLVLGRDQNALQGPGKKSSLVAHEGVAYSGSAAQIDQIGEATLVQEVAAQDGQVGDGDGENPGRAQGPSGARVGGGVGGQGRGFAECGEDVAGQEEG